MKKEYNKDYFYPEETLNLLSKHSGKPVLYIRADGPSNCDDSQKLSDIWDFYYGKCDDNIISGLKQRGELYCFFDEEYQALDAFNEWFPQKSDLLDDEMDYYVYVEMVNFSSGVNIKNGAS